MKRLNLDVKIYSAMALICFFISLIGPGEAAAKNMFTRLYIRRTYNPRRSPDAVLADLEKARSWGINGFLFDNGGWGVGKEMDQKHRDNLERVVAKADQLGIALIPMYLSQGSPTQVNLDWGEVFLTKGTKYRISGSKAEVVGDPVSVFNGGFDGNLTGWKVYGNGVYDATEGRNAPGCIRFTDSKSSSFVQTIRLKPHKTYVASVFIKTQGVKSTRDIGFAIMGGAYRLRKLRSKYGAKGTQGWTLRKESFNSITCESASLKLVGSPDGTIWFDDIQVEEVGLYETVRRHNTPIVVKSESGKTYKEGIDYVINVASPVLANNQGTMTIPSGSSIGSGETVFVDWYKWATNNNVPAEGSWTQKGLIDILNGRVDYLDSLFHYPRSWFIKHSEWRLGCWDPTCQSTFKNAGGYFAHVLGQCEQILKRGNSNREVLFWNDEFEPYHHSTTTHNTRWKGTDGAWNSLTDDMIVVNWNAKSDPNAKKKSLLFFAGMDPAYPNKKTRQRVILGTDAKKIGEGSYNWWGTWLTELKKAEDAGLPDDVVIGICHDNYNVGVFDAAEVMARTCKAQGRWDGKFRRHDELTPAASVGESRARRKTPQLSFALQNLANEVISVSYQIPHNGHVEMSIVNTMGKTIRVLRNAMQRTGTHEEKWDSSRLAGGVYFIRLSFDRGASVVTKRMVTF